MVKTNGLQRKPEHANMPKIFATNEPSLILVLAVIHNLPVMGTLEGEDQKSRYFIFEDSEQIKEYVALWNKLQTKSSRSSEIAYNYMHSMLSTHDMHEFNLMLSELMRDHED